jgi:hypothetical protein
MSGADHAIVVGIARYPALGEGGQPLDLKGPLNDVEAVVGWLADPAGGDVPAEHIQVITSPPPGAPAAGRVPTPTVVELEEALQNLDRIAQASREAMRGEQVGRRLYIYMSGHGFSPARERGCLYAANARERSGDNVHASAWLAWLQDAGYFREFVLWMDCCMNRMLFLPPRDPPLPPVNAPVPPGPSFVAFAAQRPLKAVEASIPEDGGRTHGLFTWALLEGLRGAAADTHGRVTGRSLADWLRNAQGARLSEADRNDPEVATEPEVVREDPGLVFARGIRRRTYAVALSFPAALPAGAEARVWTGCPARVVERFAAPPQPLTLRLAPGLYVADIPAAGIRQGFEVLGPRAVPVAERGAPVAEPADPGAMFDLAIDPQEPATEIFIVDDRLALVDRGAGALATTLPFGVYKLKTRLGRGVREQIVLLDGPLAAADGASLVRPLATAVPLAVSAAIHEYHLSAAAEAAEASRAIVRTGEGRSALTVMARVWTSTGAAPADAEPWRGVSVVDGQGRTVLDLSASGRRTGGDGDPLAVATVPVEPGTYFLRHALGGGPGAPAVEQSVVVPPAWSVSVHILREVAPDGRTLLPRPRLSLVMRNPAQVFDAFEQREVEEATKSLEAAQVALGDERRVLNEGLERLLFAGFFDPMAGIVGGHLLLVEAERGRRRDLAPLNALVRELRERVGPEHPDVEALSLRCPDEALRRTAPVRSPPMLQRSWALLAEASWRSKRLVPAALWRRVRAAGALPPFLVWSADEETRAAAAHEIAAMLRGAPAVRSEAGGPDGAAAGAGGLGALLRLAPGILRSAPAPPAPGPVSGGARPAAASARAAMRAAARRLGLPAVALDLLADAPPPSGR